MQKNLALSGMIHAKFKSESAMARAMGWSKQRLSKITCGRRTPTLGDLDEMATILERPIMDLVQIFLPEKSTNVDA